LFDDRDLSEWLEQRREECAAELEQVPEAEILAQPLDEVAEPVLSTYLVEAVELQVQDKYAVDQGEIKVWGSGGMVTERVRVRFGGDPGVPGRSVAVHVPFSGDPHLLLLRPSKHTIGGARGRLEGHEIVFPFESPSNAPLDLETATAGAVRAIEDPNLKSQSEEVAQFNENLRSSVATTLLERRRRILDDRKHLEALGMPVYRREDAPTTYAAPGIEKRAAPAATDRRTRQSPPMEPAVAEAFYEHIIQVVTAMARGMERNPGDYANWQEEQLRDALLVMLNTHYEGQATGETFNKSGKTDIIIRIEDSNVFVAECKWWDGASRFASSNSAEPSALDQLLGYATWRDAKLALTVFVRNKEIDKTIKAACEALETHHAFLGWTAEASDGQIRARVKLGAGDLGADLAVIFVHLPRP